MKIPNTQKAISADIKRLYHKGFTNLPQTIAIAESEAGNSKKGGGSGHHGGGHRGHTGKGQKKG